MEITQQLSGIATVSSPFFFSPFQLDAMTHLSVPIPEFYSGHCS